MDGTITSPGDTFTLVMPCVYKFMTYETSVQLTANSIAYATCDFDAGEDTKSFSSLKCTVTDELTEDTSVLEVLFCLLLSMLEVPDLNLR